MTDTLWSGRFLEIKRTGTWEFVARRGAVGAAVILAITADDEIILVEQHRPPLGCRVIELPAGLVGDTDATDTHASAAARELHEETGFEGSEWTHIGRFASSPGLTSEAFDMYRANGLDDTDALEKVILKAQGRRLHVFKVTDAGHTVFDGPTITCAAIGPMSSTDCNAITRGARMRV